MIEGKSVDLNRLGKRMNEQGMGVSQLVMDNMCSILESFGGITYEEEVLRVQEKHEDKKGGLKKDVEPKFVDITERRVSYADFSKAIKTIESFDVQLLRLGFIKSQKLEIEAREVEQQETEEKEKWLAANTRGYDFCGYDHLISHLSEDELPEIPVDAANAIVINLFCIDEIFESRSL